MQYTTSQDEVTSTVVETVHLSPELGQFEIEPLGNGFGLTLGNALRRVLLSSLEGAGITALKIQNSGREPDLKDIYHEFSAIPGVREDTTELILNLKQVRLKSYTDEATSVRLESSGPGVVTAGDIQVPPEIEIVNPELPIATLDSREAHLEMLLTIEKGRGYRTAEQGGDSSDLGMIHIDSIFTPIRRVNYKVEKTRVGERTDYDKLMLEIQTDGTVNPKEALAQAAQILIEHFQIFAQLSDTVQRQDSKPVIGSGPISQRLQDMAIEVLDLSSRTYNCLKRSQITTVGQVLNMSEDELLGLRNFGQKSLQELHDKLASRGIIPADEGSVGDGGDYGDEIDADLGGPGSTPPQRAFEDESDLDLEFEEEEEKEKEEDRRGFVRPRARRSASRDDE